MWKWIEILKWMHPVLMLCSAIWRSMLILPLRYLLFHEPQDINLLQWWRIYLRCLYKRYLYKIWRRRLVNKSRCLYSKNKKDKFFVLNRIKCFCKSPWVPGPAIKKSWARVLCKSLGLTPSLRPQSLAWRGGPINSSPLPLSVSPVSLSLPVLAECIRLDMMCARPHAVRARDRGDWEVRRAL